MSSIADVVNGQVQISESSQKTEKTPSSNLGKEDFLLLLVTQMRYQDPMEPTDNTEYVAQLAQFSELEQMQNLNGTVTNTSAFSLVGKTVHIEHTAENGSLSEMQGVVDYVTMKNGEAFVTIDGADYPYEEITQVIDTSYVIAQKSPSVEKQKLTYLHHDPQDVKVTGVSFGKEDYQAASVAVALVDSKDNPIKIDSSYLNYKNGTLTISKKAFESIDAGTYKVALVFDDANKTMNYEDVTLVIKGMTQKPANDDTSDDTTSAAGDNNQTGTTNSTTGDTTASV